MIEIDISADIEQAERQLFRYERQIIPRAASRAINRTRDNMRTAVNRAIAKRTGLKIAEIKKAQFLIKSSPKTLWAMVMSRRRPYNLRRFVIPKTKLAIGGFSKQLGVVANPWRKRRLFKGAFIIRGATHGKLIVVKRTGIARNKLEGMHGPALHVEFNRPSMRRLAKVVIARRFRINFERDLAYYVGLLK